MPDKLTTKQAAEKLGVSERRVRTLCQNGRLPAQWTETPFGGYWLIDPQDLGGYTAAKVGWQKGRPRKPKPETDPEGQSDAH